MNDKDLLIELVGKSNLSNVELRKIIYSYFDRTKEIDIELVKIKTEEIIQNDLDFIPDSVVKGLIKLLEPVVLEIEKKQEIAENDLTKLRELYNESIIENNRLKKIIEQKNQQITKLEVE